MESLSLLPVTSEKSLDLEDDPIDNITQLNSKLDILIRCMGILESQIDDLKFETIFKKKAGLDFEALDIMKQIKKREIEIEISISLAGQTQVKP